MGRTVYIVTHPEAVHHVNGVVGGWHDSDLTPRGRRHAEAIANALRRQLADQDVALYTSDLRRARDTADIVAAALRTVPIIDARLREKSYGDAEGRPQSWLDERFIPPPAIGDRLSHDEGIDGSETKGEFAKRVHAAVDDIVAVATDETVIVTHGFALTFVITAWLRIPHADVGYASFASEPGSITTLVEDDYFHNRQVVTLADTTHLEMAGRESS